MTIVIGSTLASIVTTHSLSLVQGVMALALLVTLQCLVTANSVHWQGFHGALTGEPTLLRRNGGPLVAAMKPDRVIEDEPRAAVRQAGGRALQEAGAVILETDGSLTRILRPS